MKKRWFALASLAFVLSVLTVHTRAETRVRVGVGVRAPAHGAGFYFSYGAPHYHRYYRPVRPVYAGPRVVRIERVNYGSVDFNVQPQKSRIYVDGRYLGIADDFNGYPQTAKLSPGYHTVRVVAPNGRSESRRIYVAAGRELNFNLKF